MACLRPARATDLGRRRAHVLRRADVQPAGAGQAAPLAHRPHRHRPVPDRSIDRRAPTSTTSGWSSGPVGTRPIPVRPRSMRRPRWRASPTSRPASVAGTHAAGSTRCARRCSVWRNGPGWSSGPVRRWPRSPRTSGRVDGVDLADGARHDADIVVANTDAELLYSELLDDPAALRKVRRAKRSTSGFALCIGVRGLTPSIGHHNVWFSDDSAAEFDAIERGELAADPTLYACVSSVTDATQAPDGCENWFVLVNTPPGVEVDADAVRHASCSTVSPRTACRSRVGSSSSNRCRRATSRSATALPAARSTARRRTGCGPRSDAPPTVGRWRVCTSSEVRAIPAAVSRSSCRARGSSPTWSRTISVMSALRRWCPTRCCSVRGSPPRPSPSPGSPAPPGWPRRSDQPRNLSHWCLAPT